MKLRILCVVLLLLVSFSSCEKEQTNSASYVTEENIASEITDASADGTLAYELTPPELEAKELGFDFNILVRDIKGTGYIEEVYAEELNGDNLNDAVYHRNAAVSEKYSVNLIVKRLTNNTFIDGVKTSVLAGDNAYDMIYANAGQTFILASEGLVLDMNTLPVVDYDKAWWSSELLRDSSINNKNRFAVSDMNLQVYNSLQVFMFNKTLAENYAVGDIYGIVKDGHWTYERLIETAKKVSGDADGDGQMTRNDLWGMGNVSSSAVILPYSAGLYFVEKDSDDMPRIKLTQKFLDFFTRIVGDMSDSSYSLYIDRPELTSERMTIGPEVFFDNRLLLLRIDLGGIAGYREYDSDFGILPPPKYDESQENYISVVHPSIMTGSVIPITNKRLEETGMILEEMAYQSYLVLRPTYIEYCVKGKYSRDNESAEILDMILDNYGLDLAFAFSDVGLGIVGDMRELMNRFDTNVISAFDKKMSSYEAALSEIAESMS